MEQFIERSLLVDASFTSRRQLLQQLRESEAAREIIEAPSVREAIATLENSPFDACIVGPTLSETVAVDFVRRGIEVSRQASCAFLAVVGEGRSSEPLIRAGAHGTLDRQFSPTTFRDLVQRAITLANERVTDRDRARDLARPVTTYPAFVRVLNELASGFEAVAADLARGRFTLREDGQPSLATRDALRLVVEKAIAEPGTYIQIGSFDHYFVSKVVEWFIDRINTDQNTSVARLRQKLVAYRSTSA